MAKKSIQKKPFGTVRELEKAIREAAKLPAGGRVHCWHERHKGFGARISTGTGRTVFVIMRRPAGSTAFYKKTLKATTLATATDEALPILETLRGGKSPKVEELRAVNSGFATVFADFKKNRLKVEDPEASMKTGKEVAKTMERHLSPWMVRQLGDITSADVRDVVRGINRQDKPYAANRVLSHISAFFDWAIENNFADVNPAVGVKAPGEEKSRDRVLSEAEIKTLWSEFGNVRAFGPAMRFMLATAQRRGEVAGLKWSDIDFDKKVWTIAASGTKADRIHDVHLSPLAIAIIKSQPRFGDYVFMTTKGRAGANSDKKLKGWSKAKGSIEGVDDWRIHDLRRTAASWMAEMEIPPHVVAAVLNHAPGSTLKGATKVYIRFRFAAERRRALRLWSLKLQSVITGRNNRKALLGFGAKAGERPRHLVAVA